MDVLSQRNCGRCDALDTCDSLASGHRFGIETDASLDTLYTDHHVLAVDIADLRQGNFRAPHAVSSTVITRARCMRLPTALMS